MEDPLGFEAGVNFYAYVGNNPVNFNDPTGHCGPLTPLCIAALYGAGSSLAIGGAIRGGVAAYQGNDIADAVFDTNAMLLDGGLGVFGGVLASGAKAYQVSKLPSAAKGDLGEALFRTQLDDAGAIYAEQIATRTGNGNQFTKIDFGVLNASDDIAAYEIKTFNATLSPNQTALQNTINTGGSGTAFGTRATAAGFSGKSVTSFDEVRYGAFDFVSDTYPILGGSLTGAAFNTGSQAAGGGFVLYPSKPNTNMMQSVYSK